MMMLGKTTARQTALRVLLCGRRPLASTVAASASTLLQFSSPAAASAWVPIPLEPQASTRWYSRSAVQLQAASPGLPSFLSNFADLERDIRHHPIDVLSQMTSAHNWQDRIQLQKTWTLSQKGWQVSVEWKETPLGVGVFASHNIAKGSLLRVGTAGRNLLQFHNAADIEYFCSSGGGGGEEYHARLGYVADYLWGQFPETVVDDQGYPLATNDEAQSLSEHPGRFFGVWIPGNGLNHSLRPNTVYKTRPGGMAEGLYLVALHDIRAGEELYDDYRRHGRAPSWLKQFGSDKQISLNFQGCNEFL